MFCANFFWLHTGMAPIKETIPICTPKNPRLNSTGSPCVMQKKWPLIESQEIDQLSGLDLKHARYFLDFNVKLINWII